MVAQPHLVRERLGLVRAYVRDLREFARIERDAFLANRERQYATLHAVQLAIEACVDIATHICASDGFGLPATYAEAFDLLERGDVLEAALAERLRSMARFRNLIVHMYGRVDLERVWQLMQESLGDFDRYADAIERYLSPAE